MTATATRAAQTPQHRAADGEAALIGGAQTQPDGHLVLAGDAAVARRGADVVVRQRSTVAVIALDEFSLEANATLQLEQPSAQALTVLVVHGGAASTLAGRLEAPGRVVLSNPHGVVLAPSAEVVAAGLVAAAHALENALALAACDSHLRFASGAASAVVENAGAIRVAEAGFVALVGPQVRHSGTIVAPRGRVALAACAGATVTPDAAELIGFTAGHELTAIVGDGGSVEVSGVVQASSVIRLQAPGEVRVVEDGRVEAAGGGEIAVEAGRFVNAGLVAAEGGRIAITADHVGLGGRVSVSGASAGRLAVTSSGVLSLGERVEAKGLAGAGGQVCYRAERVVETASSETDASGSTDGGVVSVVAQREVMSSGTYRAAGGAGCGGWIDMTAADVRLLSARLATSGPRQGGLVRVGGAFQGGRATGDASEPAHAAFVGRWGTLPGLAAAESCFVNDSTAIDVSSAAGVGGTAVIWSDVETTFLGGIAATGQTGGGAVEISSAGELRQAQLLNVDVGNGQLLLDPQDISIVGAGAQGWLQKGILDGKKQTKVGDSRFGTSVALSADGTRLAVGAQYINAGGGGSAQACGAVYLFSFHAPDFGGAKLEGTIGNGYTGGNDVNVKELREANYFGTAVALSADGMRLAVGAYGDGGQDTSNPAKEAGAVYLFKFDEHGDFRGGALTGIIGMGYKGPRANDFNVSALSAGDSFGRSVALSADGTRLVVGAPAAASKIGVVHLFKFTNGDFVGCQPAGVIGQGDVAELKQNDNFGTAVALSADGKRLAVGAYGAGDGGGAVFLFKFADRDFGSAHLAARIGKGLTGPGTIIDPGQQHLDFGWSVALNAAGTLLAVGADNDAGQDGGSDQFGAVCLFAFEDQDFGGGRLTSIIGKGYAGGNNVNVQELKKDDGFGTSVALSADGTRRVVGTYGGGAGAVYLFTDGESNPSTTFVQDAAASIPVKAPDIAAALTRGAEVKLQASNDITVAAAIKVMGGSSSVGGLTLQAGRSVTVKANIETNGGNVTLIANEGAAAGVIRDYRKLNLSAEMSLEAGNSIDAGSGAVKLLQHTAANVPNAKAGDITLAGTIKGATIQVISEAVSVPGAEANVVLAKGASLTASGPGDALVVVAGSQARFDNKEGGPHALSAANGRWLVWMQGSGGDLSRGLSPNFKQYRAKYGQVQPKGKGNGFLYREPSLITVLGLKGEVKKTYDGNTDAPVQRDNYEIDASGFDEKVVMVAPVGEKAGQYDDEKASAPKAKWVTVSGLSVTVTGPVTVYDELDPKTPVKEQVGTITPKPLTAALTKTEVRKVYDGKTNAPVTADDIHLPGVVDVDRDKVKPKLGQPTPPATSAATYDNKNVDPDKKKTVTVTLSGLEPDGKLPATNYALQSKTVQAPVGVIEKRPLHVEGVTVEDKVHDGTDTAKLLGKATITLCADDQGHKDEVNLEGQPTAVFTDTKIGQDITVTVTGYTITGKDARNYALQQPQVKGNIIAAPATTSVTVTLTGTASKVYDGNNILFEPNSDAALKTARSAPLKYTLKGVVGNDQVDVDDSQATAKYDDEKVNVETDKKTVTVTGLKLKGNDHKKYTLAATSVSGPVGTITPKKLTAKLTGKVHKVYDGDETATVSPDDIELSGVVGNETVTAVGRATYDDEQAGSSKTVKVSGLDLVGATAKNYMLEETTVQAAVGEITKKAITLSGQFTAQDREYDGTQVAQIDTSGLTLSGVVEGDVPLDLDGVTGEFDSEDVGEDQTVRLIAPLTGPDAGNYTLTSKPPTATATIRPKPLTAKLGGTASKTYDGTKTAPRDDLTYSLDGVVEDEEVYVSGADATYHDETAGSKKEVTVTGLVLGGSESENYELPVTHVSGQVGTITPKELTAKLEGTARRTYNADTDAPLDHLTFSFTGMVGNETVEVDKAARLTATYDNKNVGEGKTVTVSGLKLDETGPGKNYTLAATPVTGPVGAIDPATLVVSGVSAEDKPYDGTNEAKVSGGTITALDHAVTFDDTNARWTFAQTTVGNGIEVIASGYTLSDTHGGKGDAKNYVLVQPITTANITPKELTAKLTGKVHKVYDGDETATVGPDDIELSGVVDHETVKAVGRATYDDEQAGSSKTVKVSGLDLVGATATNYTLEETTVQAAVGEIDPRPITLSGQFTAQDREYDGTQVAQIDTSGLTLSDVVEGDVPLNLDGVTGEFDSEDVGEDQTVRLIAPLTGPDAGNYTLTSQPPLTTTATIRPKPLTAKLTAAVTKEFRKVYDGDNTVKATVDPGDIELSGVVQGESDQVTAEFDPATATYGDKNFGTEKTVTVSGLKLKGTAAGNYKLAKTEASGPVGTIEKAPLPVTGVTVADKVYDGKTDATLHGGTVPLVDADKDHVTLVAGHGVFAQAGVGKGIVVTASSYSLESNPPELKNNYDLKQPSVPTATITKMPLEVTGVTAEDKDYDGKTDATLHGGSIQPADYPDKDTVKLDTSQAKGTFDTPDVGTDIHVTATGYVLKSIPPELKDNYDLKDPTGLKANITAATKSLTVTLEDEASKVYDGNNTAPREHLIYTLNGVAEQHKPYVAVDDTGATATYDTKDVNVGARKKTVTVTGLKLTGTPEVLKKYTLATTPVKGPVGTIKPKLLTVAVEPDSRRVGERNPEFRYTITGFVPGEDETSAKVTGIQVTTTAKADSRRGEYPIKVSGGSAPNYTFKYVDGILTIGR